MQNPERHMRQNKESGERYRVRGYSIMGTVLGKGRGSGSEGRVQCQVEGYRGRRRRSTG